MESTKKRKAQLWVSTVVYTLISLALISMLLIAARPKIEQAKDSFTIQSNLNTLQNIDKVIRECNLAPGASRELFVRVSKGSMIIDSDNDQIIYELLSSYKYSEPGVNISIGNVNALTTNSSAGFNVKLWLNYTDIVNLTSDEGKQILTQTGTPYKIYIKNQGPVEGGILNQINIKWE